MFKKFVAALLLLCILHYPICAMKIDYTPFFEACKNEQLELVLELAQKPNININHQNEHGETVLLHAASHDAWKTVDTLLNITGIDKNIKDKYEQSLFSKSVYATLKAGATPYRLSKILPLYLPEELNTECRNFPIQRNQNYEIIHPVIDDLVTKALKQSNNPSESDIICSYTEAKKNQNIPRMITLLETYPTALLCCIPENEVISFIFREAFNNHDHTDRCVAQNYKDACILMVLSRYITSDVAGIIIKLQSQLLENDIEQETKNNNKTNFNDFSCAVATHWYVLVNSDDTLTLGDKQRFLLNCMLFLSGKSKTELNRSSFLKQIEKKKLHN